MAGFKDIVQKAFYLGVGLADYVGEKAGVRLTELRSQAQKLADEMVSRGEMTTEEAKKFVEDTMNQAQTSAQSPSSTNAEPRRIEILSEDEEPPATSTPQSQDQNVEKLRQQVIGLQEELQRLKRGQ